MDTSGPSRPTHEDKNRFLKKIQEWRELGFDTGELERLLETDFYKFLQRRHEILKKQVERDKGFEAAFLASEQDLIHYGHKASSQYESTVDAHLEPFEPIVSPENELGVTPDTYTHTDVSDDDLLLLGEPLPPEDEAILEPEEESVIFVGKFQKPQKSKMHKTRETPVDKDEKVDKVETIKPTARPGETEKQRIPTESYEDEEIDNELDGTEDEFDDRSDFEESFEESDELGEDDERERERKYRKTTSKQIDDEARPGSAVGKLAAAIVVIIVILASFYLIWDFPLPTVVQEEEKVKATFEISPNLDKYDPGTLIRFDASSSSGKDLKYSWTLGSDFKVYEGSLKSKIMNGFFYGTENNEKNIIVNLEVSGKNNKDIASKNIVVKPKSFSILDEKLGDFGEYKVTGSLKISNPDGIQKFTIDNEDITADVTLKVIDIDFETKDSVPMTQGLKSTGGIMDGFLEEHSVFERTIIQNLDLTGIASGEATIKKTSVTSFPINTPYPIHSSLKGTMNTIDRSYTDLHTYNTIYGIITNQMDLTGSAQVQGLPNIGSQTFSFSSDDKIESYPNLQKDPRSLRLVDLTKTKDELSLDDQSAISVNNVIYIWHAKKIEYIYDRPAIMVNLSIDDKTMLEYNLEEFFLDLWIAEDVSIPVKTYLHSVQYYNGNRTEIDYNSLMTDFTEGNSRISDDDCLAKTSDGHFYKKHPDYSYYPSTNWTYLPPTGSSIKSSDSTTSLQSFTSEHAIQLAQQNEVVSSFLSAHPKAFVTNGYCTSSGNQKAELDKGILHWNLTFGYKNSRNALNVIIADDGVKYTEEVQIDEIPNSTEDFAPILSLGSAEDIFNEPDLDYYDIIFNSESRVDFDSVTFGVSANLQYPNVEITSIMFIEHSKYAYLVTYEKELEDERQIINIALDSETGQLLYYFDHTDNGFNIFET